MKVDDEYAVLVFSRNGELGFRRLTWYGVLLMQTSKNGKSVLQKSPIMMSSFRCSGLRRSEKRKFVRDEKEK